MHLLGAICLIFGLTAMTVIADPLFAGGLGLLVVGVTLLNSN